MSISLYLSRCDAWPATTPVQRLLEALSLVSAARSSTRTVRGAWKVRMSLLEASLFESSEGSEHSKKLFEAGRHEYPKGNQHCMRYIRLHYRLHPVCLLRYPTRFEQRMPVSVATARLLFE